MIVTLFLAQTRRNSSLFWKILDNTLRPLHHSFQMVNCIQTMSKKQTFWTNNFSLYLLQSKLWNSSSCVSWKYETFKTQVYTLLVIFHQVLTAITATFLMSVFQWLTFRSYYRTWNQTRPQSRPYQATLPPNVKFWNRSSPSSPLYKIIAGRMFAFWLVKS